MVKAFLSTFALSLFCFSSLWAQRGEQELRERLLSKDLAPVRKDWQMDPKSVPKDLMGMKGQTASLIDWTQDPDEATDIHRWLIRTEIKGQTPDWLVRLRNARQMELVGKIISCAGLCEVVRGISTTKGEHLSQILEGDELSLGENSTAWVYLIDGSLIRVAAKSTVTFQEVNFKKDEVLLYLKLLQGHVHYLPRFREEAKVNLGPQTDTHTLPLMIEEANENFYERKIFQKQAELDRLGEYILYDEHGKNHLFKFLNDLKVKNNALASLKTTLILVAPNMTATSEGVALDMMYLLGSKGYLKRRSEGKLNLTLRGYTRTEPYEIYEDEWLEVSENGRGYQFIEGNKDLEILELITRRVASFQVAQEKWYEAFTLPILKNLNSAKDMAELSGYLLWDERFSERKAFLEEYSRRLETTHLQSLANLITKMENRGEELVRIPTNVYYQKSLDSYMWSLKNQFNFDQLQIRETNNLQYYVWILKNVKSKKL